MHIVPSQRLSHITEAFIHLLKAHVFNSINANTQ